MVAMRMAAVVTLTEHETRARPQIDDQMMEEATMSTEVHDGDDEQGRVAEVCADSDRRVPVTNEHAPMVLEA